MTATIAPPVLKDAPYIWVTWLAPLLAGNKHCQWAAWFQSNYKFQRETDNGFLKGWAANHEALLQDRADYLEKQGYTVYLEDQNSFTIKGSDKRTVISGKADIVAIKEEEIIVEDCKTGKKKDADPAQVLLYMLLLAAPGGPRHCHKRQLSGRLVYQDEVIDIPSDLLDGEFKDNFRNLVRRVSSNEPARKAPGLRECRYCKISSSYCSERKNTERTSDEEEHNLF